MTVVHHPIGRWRAAWPPGHYPNVTPQVCDHSLTNEMVPHREGVGGEIAVALLERLRLTTEVQVLPGGTIPWVELGKAQRVVLRIPEHDPPGALGGKGEREETPEGREDPLRLGLARSCRARIEEGPSVSNDRRCCLCSQIEGQPANDLIAAMLPDQPYVRRVMLETNSFAVVPSLGPLVPGHSLLCPRAHLRSFAEVDRDLDGEFLAVKEALRGILARLYDAAVHLFEHGMATDGTRTVCTVDHAHMHFVPLSQSIDAGVVEDGRWIDCDGSLQALRALCGSGEYILYESPDGGSRILRSEAGALESQYMRKLFAKWVGHANEWDWRATPNALLTDEAWRRFVRSGSSA
jgi:diadenosine tetraphosphate (Ap4A) HIT family hydrolase